MRSGDSGGVGCFLCGNAVPWNLLGRVPRHGRPAGPQKKASFGYPGPSPTSLCDPGDAY
jgi:hypothetical protein